MRSASTIVGIGAASAIGGCMFAPATMTREALHPVVLAVLVLGPVLAASFVYHLWRHLRLAAGMAGLAREAWLAGESVGLVAGLESPLVAGIRHPRIYCGDDIATRLDPIELRAVMLHERHHQMDRAPFRLVVLATVAPFIERVGGGRAWLERERARIEIAADRSALRAGVGRAALASALLKLAGPEGAASTAGFASASDLRVRALLGEPLGFDVDRSTTLAALAVVGLVAACLVAFGS